MPSPAIPLFIEDMNTLVYVATRMISLLVGWAIAWGLAWIADFVITGAKWPLITGAKWPVFIALAGWWTYVAVKYVGREADRHRARFD
jgi:hypothetical protein